MQTRILQAELEEALERLFQTLRSVGVRLEQADEVRDYLRQHPDLVEVVAHAVQKTRDAFPEVVLILQLYHDPEIEEDTFLNLLLRSESYPSEFWKRRAQLR
ncbi:MAG: hypothetical protein NZL85_11875, partial [Fimbriimonadales bacterium]|nr:hypothetical protein [Fimbriimonadales bacterium]